VNTENRENRLSRARSGRAASRRPRRPYRKHPLTIIGPVLAAGSRPDCRRTSTRPAPRRRRRLAPPDPGRHDRFKRPARAYGKAPA
jgi:hypothetical protein